MACVSANFIDVYGRCKSFINLNLSANHAYFDINMDACLPYFPSHSRELPREHWNTKSLTVVPRVLLSEVKSPGSSVVGQAMQQRWYLFPASQSRVLLEHW